MTGASGTLALSCYGLTADEVVPIAQKIEAAGFDGLWLGEHVVIPVNAESQHPYPSSLHTVPIISEEVELIDLWVAFAAMAATTSRIFFGSGVCILPLRHPLLTAQATVSLQRIARGRLIVGGATGWLEEEFDALQQNFGDRGARTEEIIEVLRLAWHGGPFRYDGTHHHFEPVVVTPRPVKVPLVLGGTAPRALRRAARWGDGWRNPSSWTLDQCIETRERLIDLLEAKGRSPETFRFHISMLDATPDALDLYRDVGFVDLSLPTFAMWRRAEPVPLARKLDDIDRLAEMFQLRPP